VIIITSLSPSHSNAPIQQVAVDSWQGLGKIYSMNCKEEVRELKDNYTGVEFLETCKTLEYFTGKFHVSINSMIDVARAQGQDLLLINSDIELSEFPELRQDGITIFSRYDYEDLHTKVNAKMFIHGFDVVYVPYRFLKIFPPSIYALGVSHWDHWLPYHAFLKSIPIYSPKKRHAYHKLHETQYSVEQWMRFSEYFKLDFNFDKRLNGGQVATQTMYLIRSKIIPV
jgi:hypothetical protein